MSQGVSQVVSQGVSQVVSQAVSQVMSQEDTCHGRPPTHCSVLKATNPVFSSKNFAAAMIQICARRGYDVTVQSVIHSSLGSVSIPVNLKVLEIPLFLTLRPHISKPLCPVAMILSYLSSG